MSRKRKTIVWLTICLLIAVAAYAGNRVYSNTYFDSPGGMVTLRFHYMQYACGDCYPQWNADSVITSHQNSTVLLDKDMVVEYRGKRLDDQLSESVWNCIICTEFHITGKVKKTLSGKHKFIAENYKYVWRPGCCDN